jgi:hypothetical protein
VISGALPKILGKELPKLHSSTFVERRWTNTRKTAIVSITVSAEICLLYLAGSKVANSWLGWTADKVTKRSQIDMMLQTSEIAPILLLLAAPISDNGLTLFRITEAAIRAKRERNARMTARTVKMLPA